VIDGIKPEFLGQRGMQHRCVIGRVQRPEAGTESAHTLVSVDFEIENLHRESVAWLRAFDVKRPGQRIVSGSHAQCVPRLLDGVAEAVECVGVENIPRLEVGDRFDRGVHILHVAEGALVFHDVGGGLRLGGSRDCEEDNRFQQMTREDRNAHFVSPVRRLNRRGVVNGKVIRM